MKSLLNELEAHAGKISYQNYLFEHGIERLTLLVPVGNADAFQEEFASSADKSKRALLEIVSRHAGKVRL